MVLLVKGRVLARNGQFKASVTAFTRAIYSNFTNYSNLSSDSPTHQLTS
jgi:hypothetical protein